MHRILLDQFKRFSFVEGLPQVDDGWFPLLYRLCRDIEEETNKHPNLCAAARRNFEEEFKTTQIKEKFGELCFYVNYYPTNTIMNLIADAEAQSRTICEICGGIGRESMCKGNIKTICSGCARDRGYHETKPTREPLP